MKKILFILCITAVISCKKENNITTSNCKLSRIISVTGSKSDTTDITYFTDSFWVVTKNSNGNIYKYSYVKSGNQYTYKYYANNIYTLSGTMFLTASGYIDSTSRINVATSLQNYSYKAFYDAEGHAIKTRDLYIGGTTYSNRSDYEFQNGNVSKENYSFYNFTTATLSNNDSVVCEYTDKPNLCPFEYADQFLYGKTAKNLLQTKSYYSRLNSNTLRLRKTYAYTFNSDGYVTQMVYTRSDLVLSTSSTTTYTFSYLCE